MELKEKFVDTFNELYKQGFINKINDKTFKKENKLSNSSRTFELFKNFLEITEFKDNVKIRNFKYQYNSIKPINLIQ
jgi:hypothetical protein